MAVIESSDIIKFFLGGGAVAAFKLLYDVYKTQREGASKRQKESVDRLMVDREDADERRQKAEKERDKELKRRRSAENDLDYALNVVYKLKNQLRDNGLVPVVKEIRLPSEADEDRGRERRDDDGFRISVEESGSGRRRSDSDRS